MSRSARRVRLWIACVAALVAAGLFALKWAGVGERLLAVLAVAGAALVTLLFVTYRALARIVEMAEARSAPPPTDDRDEE